MKSKLSSMALAASLAALIAGCQEDDIRRYQVPKAAPEDAPAVGAKVRMIGAIFPREDSLWFIKLSGPVAEVETAATAVSKFVGSVRFPDDKAISWTVPEGWKQDTKPHEMRYATFLIGSGAKPLELTVTKLPPQSVLDNVNRWRGQLGLPPVSEENMETVCKKLDVAGGPVFVMDMVGTQNGKGMPPFAAGGKLPAGHPPMNQRPQPEPAADAPKFAAPPKDWAKAPNSIFSVATFRIMDGDQRAEVTVSPLGGPAGGQLANVNRWRSQVGLKPVADQDELDKLMQAAEVDGQKGQLVDLDGPTGKRILAIMVKKGPVTWFFKMTGSSELVGKQKDAFTAFVKSMKLPAGGDDE